jgi:ribosomal protein S18 acetylase RimI-like enzyme
MEIRQAEPRDLPALKPLWIEFMDYHLAFDPDYTRRENAVEKWAEYVDSKFREESAALFVAVESEKILGYIGALVRDFPPVYVIEKHGYIEEIAVTREWRRRGIAERLYSAAETWLLAQGVDRIRVTIDVANEASQGFFRSRGFLDDTETLTKKF